MWVSGVLHALPSSVLGFSVDGVQSLRTACTLNDAEIMPMPSDAAAPQRFR